MINNRPVKLTSGARWFITGTLQLSDLSVQLDRTEKCCSHHMTTSSDTTLDTWRKYISREESNRWAILGPFLSYSVHHVRELCNIEDIASNLTIIGLGSVCGFLRCRMVYLLLSYAINIVEVNYIQSFGHVDVGRVKG